jgi:hypothetical protein
MKFIFLILLILLLIFLYKSSYTYFEDFNTDYNIIFLTKEETSQIITSNSDNYFEKFNNYDLIARNVNSLDEYLEKISDVPYNFTSKQKEIITNCIIKINSNLINKINESWIENNKLLYIPWKIGVIKTLNYEYGLPHTRNDVIIIPVNIIEFTDSFANTLLHEKLHVYQKMYPDDFDIYLKENNFNKHQLYINTNINYRSNPDVDDWIYEKDGKIYVSEYKQKPKTILDVNFYPKNSYKYEHPREKSVYDLLDKI